MNYFSLFGLSVHYQIDIQRLTSTFRNLQRQHHPDKFANSTQAEQLAAVKQSAIINQAWKTLINPLTRAEYLLSLHGFNLINERHTICDTAFLIKQLKLHEELDSIKQEKDKVRLEIFIKRIKEMFEVLHTKLIKYLNDAEWSLAYDIIRKLSFLDKLHNSAEQLAEELLDF